MSNNRLKDKAKQKNALARELRELQKHLAKMGVPKKRSGAPRSNRRSYTAEATEIWAMDFHYRLPRLINYIEKFADMGPVAYEVGMARGLAMGLRYGNKHSEQLDK